MEQRDDARPPFDALAESRRLLRSIRAGSLATTGRDGQPVRLAGQRRDRPRRQRRSCCCPSSRRTPAISSRPALRAPARRDGQGRSAGASAADRDRTRSRATPTRPCASASCAGIRNPRSMPASAISRSGGWMSRARISTAASPAPGRSQGRDLLLDLAGAEALLAAEGGARRAHERRPRRRAVALRPPFRGGGGRALARDRLRSRRHGPDGGRAHGAHRLSRSGSPTPGRCAAASSRWPPRRAARSGRQSEPPKLASWGTPLYCSHRTFRRQRRLCMRA